jgi:hypothetical protein
MWRTPDNVLTSNWRAGSEDVWVGDEPGQPKGEIVWTGPADKCADFIAKYLLVSYVRARAGSDGGTHEDADLRRCDRGNRLTR